MQGRELAILLNSLEGCKRILELGWGSGIIARGLKDAGKDVLVIEGSQAGCDAASSYGITSLHSLFEDYQTSFKHDAVIASFVLEHLADPMALLKRAHQWGKKLICVVGNANSYHRQLAVKMGIQPRLDSLSERDKLVGHYSVFDMKSINTLLSESGWIPQRFTGLMLKALPNSMLMKLPTEVIKAMCEIEVAPEVAANIMVECE